MNTESSELNGLGGYSDPYPADSEQFFLIEELYKQTDLQQKSIDDMLHNKVNIGLNILSFRCKSC